MDIKELKTLVKKDRKKFFHDAMAFMGGCPKMAEHYLKTTTDDKMIEALLNQEGERIQYFLKKRKTVIFYSGDIILDVIDATLWTTIRKRGLEIVMGNNPAITTIVIHYDDDEKKKDRIFKVKNNKIVD